MFLLLSDRPVSITHSPEARPEHLLIHPQSSSRTKQMLSFRICYDIIVMITPSPESCSL